MIYELEGVLLLHGKDSIMLSSDNGYLKFYKEDGKIFVNEDCDEFASNVYSLGFALEKAKNIESYISDLIDNLNEETAIKILRQVVHDFTHG
jgi:hypothetical protein